MSQQPPAPSDTPPTKPVNPAALSGRGVLGWILFIALAAMLLYLLNDNERNGPHIPLSEFTRQLERGNVASVELRGDKLHGTFHKPITIAPPNPTKFRTILPEDLGADWGFVKWLIDNANGAKVEVDNTWPLIIKLVISIAPWILIFGFIWFFVFRQLRGTGQQPAPTPVPVYVVNPAPVPPGESANPTS